MNSKRYIHSLQVRLCFVQVVLQSPSTSTTFGAVVLAAGRSTRFKTQKSKQLYPICGQAMVVYPLRVLESLSIPISLVLGYQRDEIRHEVEREGVKDVAFVVQEEQKGTGHALACTQHTWDKEHLLVLNGDTPLITKDLLVR
jgi:bifunctional UDP-N-acetylglucosamine pyrophosphorylase/glucosamine-1-phosphate N-acetyltransferase